MLLELLEDLAMLIQEEPRPVRNSQNATTTRATAKLQICDMYRRLMVVEISNHRADGLAAALIGAVALLVLLHAVFYHFLRV